METPEAKTERQGRFAEYLLAQPEWAELLDETKESVVGEWMRGETPEARERAHAKVLALASAHQLLRQWQDRKVVQDMQADQEQGTPAL